MIRILYLCISLIFITLFYNNLSASEADVKSNSLVSINFDELNTDNNHFEDIENLRAERDKEFSTHRTDDFNTDESFKMKKDKVITNKLKLYSSKQPPSSNQFGKISFTAKDTKESKIKKITLYPFVNIKKKDRKKQKSLQLYDYDEIWVDYDDLNINNPSILDMKLTTSEKNIANSNDEIITFKEPAPLVIYEREIISQTIWKQKNISYLLERTFDIEPSNNWHYKNSNNKLILQKRFNKELKSSIFEMLFDANSRFESLNLRIIDVDGKEKILKWNSLRKQIFRTDDTLRLRLFLNKFSSNNNAITLKEIIVFFNDSLTTFPIEKFIREINWFTIDPFFEVKEKEINNNKNIAENYFSQVTKINEGDHVQIKIKINELTINTTPNIKSVDLFIRPMYKDYDGGLQNLNVTFISYIEKKIPTIIEKNLEFHRQLKKEDINLLNNKQYIDVVNEKLIDLSFFKQGLILSFIFFILSWIAFKYQSVVEFLLFLFNMPRRLLALLNIIIGWRAAMLWWATVSIVLYSIGLLKINILGENYFFTFGAIAVVLFWRALVAYLEPNIKFYMKKSSQKLYSEASEKYFFGSFFVFLFMGISSMLNLNPIAEQLAIIGYFMLVFGFIIKVLPIERLYKNN